MQETSQEEQREEEAQREENVSLGQIESRAIGLINVAEKKGKISDDVDTGFFRITRVYTTDTAGIWAEHETLSDSARGLIGRELAIRLFGEDRITEIGIWERGQNTGTQYTIKDGNLTYAQITSKGVEKPHSVKALPEHLTNIQSILQNLEHTLSSPVNDSSPK